MLEMSKGISSFVRNDKKKIGPRNLSAKFPGVVKAVCQSALAPKMV
jgi:hypothetical protein